MERHYSTLDRIISAVDEALRISTGEAPAPQRQNPAGKLGSVELDEQQRRHVAGLMRVNHAGEIAAQGLYQGQAATARLDEVRQSMEQAAEEENDHLAWCEERLSELGSRPSVLNPVWYAGAFAIGAAAGLLGDRWSLGFVAETERQVVRHLENHLESLPEGDARSRAILEQMKVDEERHGATAEQAGGARLPAPVRQLMGVVSKVMTRGAYRL